MTAARNPLSALFLFKYPQTLTSDDIFDQVSWRLSAGELIG
jgi:hypothetical protein